MNLISGMHRSGTSLVAKIFVAAGADLGNPETFYEPDRWNPDGYFEQMDVLGVNVPLVNGPFWKLAYLLLPSEATICRRGRARSDQIRRVADRYRNKVVKENRFCLTLPAWLDQGLRLDRLLVVLREPAAVVRSLQRRNWITARRGYSLWLTHNRRLLATALAWDIPCRFVRYGHLLNPARQLDEARSMLHFFQSNLTPHDVSRVLESAVRPALNHHSAAPDSITYPAPVAELWHRLVAAHAGQLDTADLASVFERGTP